MKICQGALNFNENIHKIMRSKWVEFKPNVIFIIRAFLYKKHWPQKNLDMHVFTAATEEPGQTSLKGDIVLWYNFRIYSYFTKRRTSVFVHIEVKHPRVNLNVTLHTNSERRRSEADETKPCCWICIKNYWVYNRHSSVNVLLSFGK